MVLFDDFDSRGYQMVDVRSGYAEWLGTYEDTVNDAMDLALLVALSEPSWQTVRRAVDLGCGTGRTAAWLRRSGVDAIDGVDMTPEMLEIARSRGLHEHLRQADVADTGLPGGAYDLVIACLIDEHLADLRTFYAEAWRLAEPGALFVNVSFHPHFIMASGMPTHFTNASNEHIAITTHVHLVSDHAKAALGAGWALAEMHEQLVDDRWLAAKPKWERFRGHPVSLAVVWRKHS
jgi:SAM-dependent methyltransferase